MTGCWGTAVLDSETDVSTGSSEASGTVPTTGGGDPSDSADPPDTTAGPDPTNITDTADTGTPQPGDCAEQRAQTLALFVANCSGCHSGPNAQVFDYIEDLDRLVKEGKVEPGDPGDSQLYQLVINDVMPKTVDKLTDDEKLVIHDWIAECAEDPDDPEPPDPQELGPLDPPGCIGENEFVSIDQMLQEMHAGVTNIMAVDPDDQPFIRFFTLTHLWNAGYCPSQIAGYRDSLFKLVNSLSNQPAIVQPAAIDPVRQTMFRIDLRDYGWDAALWELLVDKNPFAVEFLQDTAVSLKSLTGTAVPFQMADWFISDASQAPLYDQVLYEQVFKIKADIFSDLAPLNRLDLEASLEIDVAANIELEKFEDLGRVARAGLQLSGVSNQNRIVERHDFLDNFSRSYWLSYDFRENVDFSNIFYHPLDFVAAGGEIIWTLPNGLQGYLLVDEKGDRVSVADVAIVSNKEHNGDPIVNGMSCMGCHYQGMRNVVDEVAPFAEMQVGLFTAEELEQIKNLYPPSAEFAADLKHDSTVFTTSVEATGAPLLIDGHEVTEIVYLAFEEQSVDLNRAAAELFLTETSLTPKIGLLPTGLQMINGGFVNRDSMRKEYAEAICNLKIGITKFCPPG